jgi:hypothetical protein
MEYDTTLADQVRVSAKSEVALFSCADWVREQAFALAERWEKARNKTQFDFSPKDLENFSTTQTGSARLTIYFFILIYWGRELIEVSLQWCSLKPSRRKSLCLLFW